MRKGGFRKRNFPEERGMDPGQAKLVDIYPRGLVFYSLEDSWKSRFVQPSRTVEGGGDVEISQVPVRN